MPVSVPDFPDAPLMLCYSLSNTAPELPQQVFTISVSTPEALIDAWMDEPGVIVLHAIRQTEKLTHTLAQVVQAVPDAVVIVLLDIPPASPEVLIERGAQEVVSAGTDIDTVIKVAQARKEREFALQYYVYFDGLTQLANRQLFQDRLEHSLEQHKRHRTDVALMILDLNRFNRINEEHGHLLGDELLQAVADRLDECTRSSDTLARIGSNSFAVIAERLADTRDAARVAAKLCEQFRAPFTLSCGDIYVTASIGVEMARTVAYDPVQIIRRAELAMHEAKRSGGNEFCLYDAPRPEDRIRPGLESALYQALDNNEMYLEYQPQVSTDGRTFVGVEALMRWYHPALGQISPVHFIPVLEETGLIEEYGIWCLRESCRQFREWLNHGLMPEHAKISVNLSARQFRQEDLADQILNILDETGLPSRNLTLEITESMLMQNHSHAVSVLHRLRYEGISVAVDDFGTGYSSLVYLKTLPVDYLKIDREFVKDLSSSDDDRAIASSIIHLAHNLRLNVVAEGVEDESVLSILLGLGCDRYQGFYFARPVRAAEIPALVERCH